MALKRTVAPTDYPVTLAELKAHLRVVDASDDGDIMAYLAAVVSHLDGPEGVLNRALITQTLEMTLDRFPGRAFDLPLPPMQSVTSVTYLDTDGASQTLATSKYRLLNAATPMSKGRIERAYGETWPSTRAVEQAVTVTWVAGYGARNAVPEHIRHLILVLVKEMYDHRDPLALATMVHSPALTALFEMSRFPAVA